MTYRSVFCSLLFMLCSFNIWAQTDSVTVARIRVEGNRKTKEAIILRELNFKIGEKIAIAEISTTLEQNRLQVLNTRLFTGVKMNVKNWDPQTNQLEILVEVRESWYLFPIPIFELADRNFNIWWVEQNRKLNRVNLGLRFYHINATGRRDILKLVTQFGYTQKYELDYQLPGLNSRQTVGFRTNLFYARNREVAYRTQEDRWIFQRFEDDYPLERVRFSGALTWRPGLFFYHEAGIAYHQNSINEAVINELNPDFFLNQSTRQRFIRLHYTFTFDQRDIRPYPMKGQLLRVNLQKDGLGVFDDLNAFLLSTSFAQYFTIGKKWSWEAILSGRVALQRQEQPYYNYRALGFEPDYLRGYEYYVIDGLDYGYWKNSFRFELLKKEINWGTFMPVQQFKIMPLRVYLSLNQDVGIVNSPFHTETNVLINRWLWSGGIGLDIITYYDKVIQIQYSINHLREKGLFLHFKLIL